jgi:hypothetical protein
MGFPFLEVRLLAVPRRFDSRTDLNHACGSSCEDALLAALLDFGVSLVHRRIDLFPDSASVDV